MDRKRKIQIRNSVVASILFAAVLIGVAVFLLKNPDMLEENFEPIELPFNATPIIDMSTAKAPNGDCFKSCDLSVPTKPFKVRGIYIAPSAIRNEEKMNALIDYAHRNDVNTFVIDIKDDYGNIVYPSIVKEVISLGANEEVYIDDISKLLKRLDDENIYPIARIVCFRDSRAGKNLKLAVKNSKGELWRDGGKNNWLNPYNSEAREYLISIMKEAAVKGFREIQLDYVRFPSEGRLSDISYGESSGIDKSETIENFISEAREALRGIEISIDSFGMITSVRGDLGIGQDLTELSKVSDLLCPMVYPSHYQRGNYNLDYPDSMPYEVVYGAMKDAKERIEKLDFPEKARLRPWLQAFTAGWLKKSYGSHFIKYGTEELNLQIKACSDLEIDEWMLWNAASNYPELK